MRHGNQVAGHPCPKSLSPSVYADVLLRRFAYGEEQTSPTASYESVLEGKPKQV